MEKTFTKKLCLTAIMIALSTVLSLVKIWQMPLGGSVTLCCMLPIVVIVIAYGTAWGFAAAFINALIQMFLSLASVLSWGLSPVAVIGTVVLDYILAYTVLGFSGVFKKKGTVGIILGVVLALCLRLLCHFITGVVIFDIWLPEEWNNVWLYSICYNGSFMLPEMVITVIGAVALFKSNAIKKLFDVK